MAALSPATLNASIRRFVEANEKGLQRSTRAAWRDMSKTITLDVATAAWVQNVLPEAAFNQLAEQYSAYVVGPLANKWRAALLEGASKMKVGEWRFLQPEVLDAIVQERGELYLVRATQQQRAAVNAVLRASVTQGMSARQTQAMLQPALSLTERQATALAKRRAQLVEAGLSDKAIAKRLATEAHRKQRARAARIARTELAAAYNQGSQTAVQQAIDAGAFAGFEVRKEWIAQEDERTCPICQALDGDQTGMSGTFDGGFQTPPAHVNCRCTVLYRTVRTST